MKMKPQKIIGPIEWSYHSEKIAELPDHIYDIGVGKHLMETTGIPQKLLTELIGPQVRTQLSTTLAFIKVNVHVPQAAPVPAYAFRRGKHIEFGTREDFKDLGMDELCDICDAQQTT